MEGRLSVPADAFGLIIFSHPKEPAKQLFRNQLVAQVFNKEGFATLLIDLGVTEEECSAHSDVASRLGEQLVTATKWIGENAATRSLAVGYFGTCAGAGAVLKASLEIENAVLVCRGGDPRAAMSMINRVKAPVMLIVGEKDLGGVEANRLAFEQLTTTKELKVIKGASHYFSELGKLGEVAVLAVQWYKKHLPKQKAA